MQTKQLISTLSLFLLCSCSSGLSNLFKRGDKTAKRNEDLVKSFKDVGDVLKKFEEKKDEVKAKSEIKKNKKYKKASSRKKKSKRKTSIKKIIKEKSKIIDSRYPTDYPEEYKEIDKKSQKHWLQFKPNLYEGERFSFDINYAGVSTGKIIIETLPKKTLGNKKVFHFHARLKTSSYYSYLYDLDDNVDSYVSVGSFSPVKYSLIQRESGQSVDDLQLFDSEKLETHIFYKRVTKKKTKKKRDIKPSLEMFQDPLSIIYFLRGLPLKLGDDYTVPMMNKGKVLILKAKVERKENLKTKIGEMKAFKIEASTQYSGDTLKSGKMTFWFSEGTEKIFLKFKAKIKIGSISGDIEKYER